MRLSPTKKRSISFTRCTYSRICGNGSLRLPMRGLSTDTQAPLAHPLQLTEARMYESQSGRLLIACERLRQHAIGLAHPPCSIGTASIVSLHMHRT